MTTPVMSDETLNAICGIFDAPTYRYEMTRAWKAKSYFLSVRSKSDPNVVSSISGVVCSPDYGYSNPLKSVHWEAQ